MDPRAGVGLVGGEDSSQLHRWLMASGLAVGVGAVGIALNAVLGSLAAILLAVSRAGDLGGTDLLVVVVAGELAFLAVGGAYVYRYGAGRPFTTPSARAVAAAVAAAFALVALGQSVLWFLPDAGVTELNSTLSAAGIEPTFLLWFAAVAFVLVGPAEELLFRGGVQGTLRAAFGRVTSNVAASALFAFVHLLNILSTTPLFSPTAVAATAVIFAISLVLGEAYERTGSLTVPVLIHSVYDATLLLLAYLAATGAL